MQRGTSGVKHIAQITTAALCAASMMTFGLAGTAAAGPGPGPGPTPPSPPSTDTGTMSAIAQITGAPTMWNQGFTGQGVGVAVIDTGVARVPGLNAAGKVIDGPDLSFDSQSPNLVYTDSFGHGTHIAGIIAGSDVAPGSPAKAYVDATKDSTKFVGIAPQAKVVNVKVGAYDGSVDVSQVIAGIYWVVEHRNDPGLNIRVLNLSFGTDSLQPASIDPLAYAVEVAWNAGIVVVAAAGNDGEVPGPLADPAYSPSVIAVGTTDPRGTIDTRDDRVASFAQHGTAERPVDVAAPGVSVISLAVPGSFIDQNVLTGKVGTRFQRASGTSQSTAVVSGLAALIISKYPTASPDAIKSYLKAVTTGIDDNGDDADMRDDNDDHFKGAGSASVALVASTNSKDAQLWLRTIVRVPTTGTGTGTLEAARGTYHVSINDIPLTGEFDIFGRPFSSTAIALAGTLQISWLGGIWNGARWTGDIWAGARWTSAAWDSADWTGQAWSGARWTDAYWDGARWSGARWSGARWTNVVWDGARWTGARWSGARWTGSSWS